MFACRVSLALWLVAALSGPLCVNCYYVDTHSALFDEFCILANVMLLKAAQVSIGCVVKEQGGGS